MLERFTISIDADLIAAFDALIARKGYENRSEAVRDLIREELSAAKLEAEGANGWAVACLSYVYDHDQHRLASRLIDTHHRHHGLSKATMHAHLDSQECMEVTILEGPAAEVRRFAEDVIAERGVRHGEINIIALDAKPGSHAHAAGPEPEAHGA